MAANARADRNLAEEVEELPMEIEEKVIEQGLVAAPLGFEPVDEFEQVFADVCTLVGQLLDVPPVGAECAAANAAIHKTAAVLDHIFDAWGSPEDLARVSHLRESSATFSRTFGGSHRVGRLARQLLEAAGFELLDSKAAPERCAIESEWTVIGADVAEDEAEQDQAAAHSDSRGAVVRSAVWVFRYEEALPRLRAMTVRLCLQRVAELQKLRGTLRWVQDSNTHVVPKPGDGSLAELLALCSETRSKLELPVDPSQRERLAEAAVRAKLNERRREAGCSIPLRLHDGLAAAARSLAYSQRKRVREGGSVKPARPVDVEVQKLLLRTPLPPGFDVAHLHFTSDELPHIFGLASTKGGNSDSGCPTAEILAKEAVGFWAAKQVSDLVWPYAAVCGIGVALDYTVNRGFIVALLVGYEGLPPLEEEGGAVATASAEMRQRRAAANAAANAHNGAAALPKSNKFGARMKTFGSSTTTGFANDK
jgi:hypothetical protein